MLTTPAAGRPFPKRSCSEEEAWADMLARMANKNRRLSEALPAVAPQRRNSRNVGRAVVQEVEKERTRIGRELHAGAGQPLAMIKRQLEEIGDCVDRLPEAAREALERIGAWTEEAYEHVRSVSHRLHPPEWQGLGIEEALRHLVETSGLGGRIEPRIDIAPLPAEPSHSVRIAIYRCAQECLGNIVRHSGATRLGVALRSEGDWIELLIADNGHGFDPAATPGEGIGLRSMREHAEALGGMVNISSSAEGTVIQVRIPLAEE
jgi:two-component system NarL family sensor kinase